MSHASPLRRECRCRCAARRWCDGGDGRSVLRMLALPNSEHHAAGQHRCVERRQAARQPTPSCKTRLRTVAQCCTARWIYRDAVVMVALSYLARGHLRAGAVVDESNRRTRQRRARPAPDGCMHAPHQPGRRRAGAVARATRMSNVPTAAPEAASARLGRVRWRVCTLLLAATTINYVDRQVLGVLAPFLQMQIGWNEIQYGTAISSPHSRRRMRWVCCAAVR